MKKLLKIALGVILFFLITGLIGIIFNKPLEESIAKDDIEDSIKEVNKKLQFIADLKAKEEEEDRWKKSDGYKVWIEHPEWSKEDCQSLSNGMIWIGMTYEQLVYLRGEPHTTNVSNYGRGNEYQWCWSNRTPSCFYGKNDGIIRAYN